MRGVVTLKGSASASAGTVAGTATGQVGVAVLRAASGSPTPPPTFGPVSPPPGTPLARAQVLGALGEETDDRPDQTFTASYELTRSGSSACPAPQAMNLVVQVFASAIVASASQARSTGDLVLDSVTVQDVPCVSPSPPTPTPT